MEIKKKITKPIIDGYTMALFVGVVAVSVLTASVIKKDMDYLKIGGILAASAFIVLVLGAKSKAKIVENKFNGEAKVLGEVGGVATLPSGWCAEDIDGVNTYTKEGYVYKVIDGVNVEIKEDGDIRPVSVGGRIMNRVFGGGWRNDLHYGDVGKYFDPLYKGIKEGGE